jgi:hypothetical protein
MHVRMSLLILTIAVPTAVVGQNTVTHNCSLGDLARRVEILYEPGRSVPCEVHYYKDMQTPEEREVLWSAANKEGYCEAKTEEFIAKLEDWGWQCGSVSISKAEADADAAAEAMPAVAPDDTDTLTPANEADPEVQEPQ